MSGTTTTFVGLHLGTMVEEAFTTKKPVKVGRKR